MSTDELRTLLRLREIRLRRCTLGLSVAVGAGSSAVLLGWILDSEPLKHLAVSSVVMLPLTAIGFFCGAAVLGIQAIGSKRMLWQRSGRVLSGVVLILGFTMLAQRIGGFELPINLLLFPDAIHRYQYRPYGLMAGNSALAFTLLGVALCIPGVMLRGRRLANGFALAIVAIAAVALVGYAYGTRSLYSVDKYAAMALSTASCFLAIGVGAILSAPQRGLGALLIANDAGSIFTRRMLPAALTIPVLLGFAWLMGRRAELVGRETGIAFMVVLIAGIYTALLLHSAQSVSALDRERANALEEAERARARAEAANRAKSDFLTMMSHELRTPLNAIRGYTQLIELGVRGPVTEEQRMDLMRIRRSEEHLLGIIGDILDFASIERGHYTYRIAPVVLQPILNDAISAVAPLADARNVRITTNDGWSTDGQSGSASSHPVAILADAQKLRQSVINLLANAIGRSSAHEPVTIEVQSLPEGILMSVGDAGRHIPSEQLETMFDPFTQVDSTLTRTTQGIGLGLAISRQLLRGMGCEIRVESEGSAGARFSVLLPRAPAGARIPNPSSTRISNAPGLSQSIPSSSSLSGGI
jgi:signal transduction histidine kinase